MSPVFAFFGIGPGELILIGIVAVMLFGERLPEVARSVGRSMADFRKGLQDIQDEVHRSVDTSPSDDYQTAWEPDREEPTAPRFEPPRREPKTEPRP